MPRFPRDEDVLERTYELPSMCFFWTDESGEGPQYLGVNFRVTPSVEEAYPHSIEADGSMSFEQAEQERERWVGDNIEELLELGLIEDVFGHEEFESVSDLEEKLDRIVFQ